MSDYFIGLTGGIASGKSALEKAFAAHGIVVADADLLAREVVQPGTPALAAVVVACGGGGITNTVASVATPSEHVLFAMGYSVLPYDNADP